MSAGRLKGGDEPPGCDGKDGVEHGVYWMRRVPLHAKVGALAGEHGFFPGRRHAGRAGAPLKPHRRAAPRDTRRLRLSDHRLRHGRGARRGVDEPYGFLRRERAGPDGILNFRQHNPRGDPCGVGEGLSPKDRRGGAGRAGHDGEQVAHPIEDDNRDAVRGTEAQGLDAYESAPAGHDDGGGHLRARVVSQAALAVIDKERAALDGEAGVVGLGRDDARLDREARAPENVGTQRPRRHRWRAEQAERSARAQAKRGSAPQGSIAGPGAAADGPRAGRPWWGSCRRKRPS